MTRDRHVVVFKHLGCLCLALLERLGHRRWTRPQFLAQRLRQAAQELPEGQREHIEPDVVAQDWIDLVERHRVPPAEPVDRPPDASRDGAYDDLVDYIAMLETVRDRVRELIASGASLQQVVGAQPTKEFDVKYGNPTTYFLDRVYATLSREAGR